MPPDADTPTFDAAIQTENIAFTPEEMISCGKCGRTNPPNRSNCLYCGGALVLNSAPESLRLRKLEGWERGWNIVVTAAKDPEAERAGAVISRSARELDEILASKTPLPVARVETRELADLLTGKLAELGIETRVVGDHDLLPEKLPVRIRALGFESDGLRLFDFNTSETVTVSAEELALLVSGSIIEERSESIEKRKRKKESKVLDSMTQTSDRPVLDLYTRSDPRGYRIYPAGFDFSSLGDKRTLLGNENIRLLADEIGERFPGVRYVDSYHLVQSMLGDVWELDARQDGTGIVRAGFGKKGWGSVATTSNMVQFTKYSRLQWHLL